MLMQPAGGLKIGDGPSRRRSSGQVSVGFPGRRASRDYAAWWQEIGLAPSALRPSRQNSPCARPIGRGLRPGRSPLISAYVGCAPHPASRVLEKVALGEEVVIAKAGKPVAQRVPVGKAVHQTTLEPRKETFVVPKDFNRPLPNNVEVSFWK